MTYPQWVARNFDASQLEDPSLTDPWHQPQGQPLSNVFRFLMGETETERPYLDEVVTESGQQLRYIVPHNPLARGWSMNIQTSENLSAWSTVVASADGAAPEGEGLEGSLEGVPNHVVVGPGPHDFITGRQYYRVQAVELP